MTSVLAIKRLRKHRWKWMWWKFKQPQQLIDCTSLGRLKGTKLIRLRKTTSTKSRRKSVPSLRTLYPKDQLGKRQLHRKRQKGNWRRSKSKWKDYRRLKKRKNASIRWHLVVFPSLRIQHPCSTSKSKKKINSYEKTMKVPRTISLTNSSSHLLASRFLVLAKAQHRLLM